MWKQIKQLDSLSSISWSENIVVDDWSAIAKKTTLTKISSFTKTWLTTADVTASTNKNYVTDAQQTVIWNTTWTNTGDMTDAAVKTAYENNDKTNPGFQIHCLYLSK